MTLSSLFRSLDDLDGASDDEDNLSPLDDLTESADDPYQHEQHSLKRTADARISPESKRVRTLQAEGALPTRQPRFGGTGAPLGETTASAPVHSLSNNELGPTAIELASSRPVSGHSGLVRPALLSSVDDAEPPSSEVRSSPPSDLCSSRVPPLDRVENYGKIYLCKTPTRVHQTKNKAVPQNLIEAVASSETLGDHVAHRDQVSVADVALVATRSTFQDPTTTTTKPVSQSRVRPLATTARAKSRVSGTAITSNSFQRGSTAPCDRDNHVAESSGVNLTAGQPSFGEQITLVSRKSRHPSKSGKGNSVKDIRDQCTTISEFASYLQTQSRDAESKGSRQKPIFRDLIVYYAANDPGKRISHSTKRRMEILSERGANVVGTFDPSVTHVVSDLAEKPLLVALALRSVKSVPPSIWVVGWTWVTKSMNSARRLEETPYERFHKRLVIDSRLSRVDKDKHRSMSVGTSETGASSEVSSREVSEAEGDEYPESARGGLSITPGSATHVETIPDPLDDVVALARSMANYSSERSSSPEISHLTEMDPARAGTIPKAQSNSSSRPHGNGFACLSRNTTPAEPCVNQALIDELTSLRDIYEAKKHEDPSNQFRVLNYNKAIRSISNHPTKITSVDQAARLVGVGTSIAEKVGEFIATGCVAKIAAQTTEDLAVTRLFQGIYGVGPQTAYSWYVRGLRTLADVRNRMGGIALSSAQELGLEYYADLQRRMPRGEAADIFERIRAVGEYSACVVLLAIRFSTAFTTCTALELDPKIDIEIMGSFRRGKPTCGDIDIMITRSTDDGGSHRGKWLWFLRRLIPLLRGRKLVTHDLAFPDDENELEAKYMGLCQLHNDTLMRRIDILTVPREQWGASLLYFTGDDLFNRSMRLLARKKGLSLNQRGLFEGVIRDPKTQKKHTEGVLIASRTEREIFDRLGVPWREPHERAISA